MTEQGLLSRSIALAKAGDKKQARELLGQLLETEPQNELAWLWFAACAETDAEKIESLNKVLAINPVMQRPARL